LHSKSGDIGGIVPSSRRWIFRCADYWATIAHRLILRWDLLQTEQFLVLSKQVIVRCLYLILSSLHDVSHFLGRHWGRGSFDVSHAQNVPYTHVLAYWRFRVIYVGNGLLLIAIKMFFADSPENIVVSAFGEY
jgi:hypothetical protein